MAVCVSAIGVMTTFPLTFLIRTCGPFFRLLFEDDEDEGDEADDDVGGGAIIIKGFGMGVGTTGGCDGVDMKPGPSSCCALAKSIVVAARSPLKITKNLIVCWTSRKLGILEFKIGYHDTWVLVGLRISGTTKQKSPNSRIPSTSDY